MKSPSETPTYGGRDTNNQQPTKQVRNWLKNWLGLNDLALTLNNLDKKVGELHNLEEKVGQLSIESEPDLSEVESRLDDVESKVEDMESKVDDFDPDDFVRSNDLDDQIDSWMSNSDFVNEDRVSDIFDEKTEELSDNIEEKVAEEVEKQVKDLNKPSKEELKELIKEVLEEMVKRLAESK